MTLIISHRGLGFGAPEHSLEGYRSALTSGADGVEVDIRLSRDGQLFCVHDSSLRRTAGIAANVNNLSHDQLQELGVAPLWEVLSLLKDVGGGKGILIETKHPVVDGSLVEHRLIEDLKFFGLVGKSANFSENLEAVGHDKPWSAVMSFSILAVRRIRQYLTSPPSVLLINQARSLRLSLRAVATDTCVGPHIPLVMNDSDLLSGLTSRKRETFVWTANTSPEIETCLQQKATCLITDNAPLALQIRDEARVA